MLNVSCWNSNCIKYFYHPSCLKIRVERLEDLWLCELCECLVQNDACKLIKRSYRCDCQSQRPGKFFPVLHLHIVLYCVAVALKRKGRDPEEIRNARKIVACEVLFKLRHRDHLEGSRVQQDQSNKQSGYRDCLEVTGTAKLEQNNHQGYKDDWQ